MITQKDLNRSEIEELRLAILNYKLTIKKAEYNKIQSYNRLYQEKILKKINIREEKKLSDANNPIIPNINTFNSYDFYQDLKKISRVYQVYLQIIPSLFLPNPCSYLFTNSLGVVQVLESEDCCSMFFDRLKKSAFPVCVLKTKNKNITMFQTVQQAKEYLNRNPGLTGVVQEFVCPATDKISVAKVHWKNNKFKYYLISKKDSVTHKNGLKSVPSITKASTFENKVVENPIRLNKSIEDYLIDENLSKQKNNNTSNSLKILESDDTEHTGILQRIQKKLQNPWKVNKNPKFYLSKNKTQNFIVNGCNTSEYYVNYSTIAYPEIENMIQTAISITKKFSIYEKNDISEIVCKFIRNFEKKWIFYGISQIKLTNIEYKEIFYKDTNLYIETKVDSDSEQVEDTVQIVEHPMEKEQSSRSLITIKSSEPQPTQIQKKSSFRENFYKTLVKIDLIKEKKRPSVNIRKPYEIIEEYKSNFKMDKDGSMQKIMLTHSNINPFSISTKPSCKILENKVSKDSEKHN
jgi:hypothetical protein